MQMKLATQASKLSRRIFASLPWGFRLAHLFTKLAVDTQEAFGRLAYAEFLKAGVEGLPDIQGAPALSLREQYKGPRGADKLPRGYGKAFGVKVWKIALSKFHNPEFVEEAISRVMMRMVSGDIHVREGSDLKTAEAFVVTSVIHAATDVVRKQRRENPRDNGHTDDDGEFESIDVADPHAFDNIERSIPQSDMAKIMRDLRQVNERAPSWVEMQLDGRSNVEIAKEWGVSPAYLTKWTGQYLGKVQAVFNQYLRDAA